MTHGHDRHGYDGDRHNHERHSWHAYANRPGPAASGTSQGFVITLQGDEERKNDESPSNAGRAAPPALTGG